MMYGAAERHRAQEVPSGEEGSKVDRRQSRQKKRSVSKRERLTTPTGDFFAKRDAEGQFSELDEDDLNELSNEIPVVQSGDIVEVLVSSGTVTGNGEARRLIDAGGISVNGQKIDAPVKVTSPSLVKKGTQAACVLAKKHRNNEGEV